MVGTFGEQLNLSKSLAFCTALALACMVTVVLAPVPMVSLLACALTGIGVSIMWPGISACQRNCILVANDDVRRARLAGDVGAPLDRGGREGV